jgi:hypothetical protein
LQEQERDFDMSIRKASLLFVLFVVLVISIQLLINYLSVGTLIITTGSSQDSINLTKVNTSLNSTTGSAAKDFSKEAKGSLSIKLKPGGYLVAVQNSASSTSRYVKVMAHKTERINIALLSTSGVEPVVDDNAQNIVADSSHLLYLNPSDSSLNQLNGQNEHTESGNQYGLRSIAWADTNYGVGQDSDGQLFTIKSGAISPLQSPASGQNDTSLVYAVAPNREVYFSLGSAVYAGTETGGFKQIYTHNTSGSFLVAGLDKVALVNIGDVQNGNGGKGVVISPSITVVTIAGKVVKMTLTLSAAAWSQHGTYLAVATGAAGEVLDGSLHQIATIPQRNFKNLTWLDDNTLFYSVQDQLWSYDLLSQSSRLITNMPLGDSIQEIAISTDKAYVYLATADTNKNITVRRVGLKDQKVPDFIYQLQDILPQEVTNPGYEMRLYNFAGKPTVTVIPNDGPHSTPPLQSAMQTLQGEGFDLSKLQFELEQGD